MSGHTEGPWAVNGSHIYAPDGEIIAQVNNPGSKETDYPLVANRNLMSASPVMFAALRGIMKHAEECIADCATDMQEGRPMDDAIAASLKRWQAVIDAVYLATGETP